MPKTIDQRLRRELIQLLESPVTTTLQKMKVAGYLMDLRRCVTSKSAGSAGPDSGTAQANEVD